jgi:hypothetical protein
MNTDAITTPIEQIANFISLTPTPVSIDSLNEDDWETIVVTAIAVGLAPLLHWHLDQMGAGLPSLALAKLKVTRQAHAKRNESIAGQLAEILAACARQKIEVLVLKGALLAPTIYAEPSLRPMNDIDLLFRPADLSKVGPVLESLGYRGKHKDAATGPGVTKHLSTYRRAGNEGSTPNPYLSPGADRMIEPHGSLEESWFGLKVDITPGVWGRAGPIMLHDQPAYCLSTDDLLLHLVVHATFHVIMGTAVFLQLYDTGLVLHTHTETLNWPRFLSLTRKAGAQPFAYAGLYWARTIFKAPVPETALAELAKACSPPLRAYIQSLDTKGLLKRTQQPPLVTLKQRLQRGLLDRWETARWAGSLEAKWKVWQTALAFHKTDTARLLKGA